MFIAGLVPTTLLDYPGKVASIVFTAGCNMRCGYCHNPHLVLPEKIKDLKKERVSEESFFKFLDERKGFLDGVVVSGGEPTLQPDLYDFIKAVKKRGFLVKLDTNGTDPGFLKRIISEKMVDYIAMDVKHVPEKYHLACGVKLNTGHILESIDLIRGSGMDYEFRTTVVKGVHAIKDIEAIAKLCKRPIRYTIQNFRSKTVLNPAFKKLTGFTVGELNKMKEKAGKFVDEVKVLF